MMTNLQQQDNSPTKERPQVEFNYLRDIIAVANIFTRDAYNEDAANKSTQNQDSLKKHASTIVSGHGDWLDWIEAIARVDEEESDFYRNIPGSVSVDFRTAARTYVQTTAALSMLKENAEDIADKPVYAESHKILQAFDQKYPEQSIQGNSVSKLLHFMMDSRRIQQTEESKDMRIYSFHGILELVGERMAVIQNIARNDIFGLKELKQ